jgi:hypothetical protein
MLTGEIVPDSTYRRQMLAGEMVPDGTYRCQMLTGEIVPDGTYRYQMSTGEINPALQSGGTTSLTWKPEPRCQMLTGEMVPDGTYRRQMSTGEMNPAIQSGGTTSLTWKPEPRGQMLIGEGVPDGTYRRTSTPLRPEAPPWEQTYQYTSPQAYQSQQRTTGNTDETSYHVGRCDQQKPIKTEANLYRFAEWNGNYLENGEINNEKQTDSRLLNQDPRWEEPYVPKPPPQYNRPHGLPKIHLEKFGGEMAEYRAWRAAFNTAIDRTTMTEEEKMLRLRGVLTGKAKALINDLQAYTPEQYQEALRRLEREYGGDKREGSRLLEKLFKFSVIRDDDKDKVKKLKDLLNHINTAISFMESAGRQGELGDGMMFTIVKSKIPETELFMFAQWQRQNNYHDSLQNIRKWLE